MVKGYPLEGSFVFVHIMILQVSWIPQSKMKFSMHDIFNTIFVKISRWCAGHLAWHHQISAELKQYVFLYMYMSCCLEKSPGNHLAIQLKRTFWQLTQWLSDYLYRLQCSVVHKSQEWQFFDRLWQSDGPAVWSGSRNQQLSNRSDSIKIGEKVPKIQPLQSWPVFN